MHATRSAFVQTEDDAGKVDNLNRYGLKRKLKHIQRRKRDKN